MRQVSIHRMPPTLGTSCFFADKSGCFGFFTANFTDAYYQAKRET